MKCFSFFLFLPGREKCRDAKWSGHDQAKCWSGRPVFEGAGWLSRQQGFTQTWVRSWYQLGFEDLLYAPNPKVYIRVHSASDLEALDVLGTSDPYVRSLFSPLLRISLCYLAD